MNQQLVIPQEAIRACCHRHSVRQMAIFGSALGDDFKPDSDVDVLSDLATEARVGLLGLDQMRDELGQIFERPVDLLTRTGLNPHIRDAVLREAQVIHAN